MGFCFFSLGRIISSLKEGSEPVEKKFSSTTISSLVILELNFPVSPDVDRKNKNAKYSATTTLSAAMVALTTPPSIFNVSATATLKMVKFFQGYKNNSQRHTE